MCPTWSWDRHLLSIRSGCSGSATCGLLCSKVLSFSNQDQVVLKWAGRDGQSCPPWPGVRDENGESRKSWGRSLLALLGQQETGKKKKKGENSKCVACAFALWTALPTEMHSGASEGKKVPGLLGFVLGFIMVGAHYLSEGKEK